MSAFIVSTAHINALVNAGYRACEANSLSWYVNGQRRTLTSDNLDATGAMLTQANAASVDYRYRETNQIPFYRHSFRLPLPAVTLLKLIDCYEYQSCERPDWPESEAYAYCDALRRRLIAQLPGYDAAPWAMSDEDEGPMVHRLF
jgi:hypothetical protein